MYKKIVLLLSFVAIFIVGLFGGRLTSALETSKQFQKTIVKSITVESLFDKTDPVFFADVLPVNVLIASDGVGYSVPINTIFMGFKIGETYCVKVQPNLPQGPYILQSFGLGECNQ